MRRDVSAFVLALSLVVTSGAWAQTGARAGAGGRPGMAGGRGGALRAALASKLDLTQEQQRQMAALRTAMVAKTEPLKATMNIRRAELQQLWAAEKPDRAAIVAKQKEVASLMGQMVEPEVDFRIGMLNVLTPEQRAQMKHPGQSFGFGGGQPGGFGSQGSGGFRSRFGARGGFGGQGSGAGGGGGGAGDIDDEDEDAAGE